MPARGAGMPVNAHAEEILARVRAIPEGFVQTYGDIDPQAPRIVGQVLTTATNDVPWHRVVRADGGTAKGTVRAEATPQGGHAHPRRPRRPPPGPVAGNHGARQQVAREVYVV